MNKCQSNVNRCAMGAISAAVLTLALTITILPGTALADEPTADTQLSGVDDQATQVIVQETQEESSVEEEVVFDEQDPTEEVVVDESSSSANQVDDGEGDVDGEEDGMEPSGETDGQQDAQSLDAPSPTVLSKETRDIPPVADGTYVIETAVANEQVLDVRGGKTEPGTNVQTYTYNGTNAQKWDLAYNATYGAYVMSLYGTNGTYVLALKDERAINGQNVQISRKKSESEIFSQLWQLLGNSVNGWNIASYLNPSLVLAISGVKAVNGTNIGLYTSNGTRGQHFYLLSTKSAAAGNKVLEDGVYEVRSKKGSGYVLDISGGSTADAANAQIYRSNNSAAQKWQFTYDGGDGNGFYTITVLSSGKVLDVAGARLIAGTNVQQYASNDTAAQKWVIRDNGNGFLTFINKATNLILDIAGGKMADFSNVWGYRDNGTDAQQWSVVPVEYLTPGICEIKPLAKNDLSLDIKSASAQQGALVQVYTDNNSLAQRFEVVRVDKNQYRIRTAASGGWLTDNGPDVAIVQTGSSTSEGTADVWEAFWNGKYFSLRNTRTNRVIDLNGSASSGTSTKASEINKAQRSHFRFVPSNLINNGYYEILSQLGKTLDIANASINAGANVQIYTANHSGAQKFKIERYGSGYRIVNAYSGMALIVNGTNVRQGSFTGTNSQLWLAEISDGGYVVFRNVASGKVLDISGGKSVNGQNVQIYMANNTNAQRWKPVVTTFYGWYRSNGHWFYKSTNLKARFDMDIDQKGKSLGHYDIVRDLWLRVNGYVSGSMKPYVSRTGHLIISSWASCYLAVFEGSKNSSARDNWKPLYGWNCANGNPAKIESTVTNKSWKWDPSWDRFLAEGNTRARTIVLPANNEWARRLGTSFSNSRIRKVNASEQYFTSVYYTLGYHTYLSSMNELGKHLSYGCMRLAYSNAQWIYENIHPGTRCLQVRTS